MKTVVLGPRPAELEALLEQRRTRGLDLFDEMWEGVLHMAPAPRATHGIVADELAGALRDAARLGMADADAGRTRSFGSAATLREHLLAMANEAIADEASAAPAK